MNKFTLKQYKEIRDNGYDLIVFDSIGNRIMSYGNYNMKSIIEQSIKDIALGRTIIITEHEDHQFFGIGNSIEAYKKICAEKKYEYGFGI